MVEGTCIEVEKIDDGLKISQPDGTYLQATHRGLLPCANIPREARIAHIFPTLQRPLVSIAQFCDHGFNVTFDAAAVTVLQGKKPVLTGLRNHTNGLWNIDIGTPPPRTMPQTTDHAQLNNVQEMSSIHDVVTYHHQTMWNPVVSTWCAAIDAGNFCT